MKTVFLEIPRAIFPPGFKQVSFMPLGEKKLGLKNNVLAMISQKRHAHANLFIWNPIFGMWYFMYPRQTRYRQCYITTWNNMSFKTSLQTLYTQNAHMWIRCTMTLLGRCMTSDLRTRWLQKFHSFHISRGGETSHKASGKLRKNQGLKEMARRFLDTFALHLGVVTDPCVSVCSENCCIVCRCAEVLPRDAGPQDTAGLKQYCALQVLCPALVWNLKEACPH